MIRKYILAFSCLVILSGKADQLFCQHALLPYPTEFLRQRGGFSFPKNGSVSASHKELLPLAKQLTAMLAAKGLQYSVEINTQSNATIRLMLAHTAFKQNKKEAYQLLCNENNIRISANDPHGIFNALQTLRQLMVKNHIDCCIIRDEPAFRWRGYMVDVGRNFQPIDLLKQQIDAMALAKLNVFHFHATENVAWRFASKKYPQLNESRFMTRDKGMFYTEAELKQLIRYCRERFIEFVPEIDMPGHSDAFTRAMGFGMQTPRGLTTVKELVKEFCDTYSFNYLHLGADEVKITMPSFVPEMVKFVRSLNKELVAWWPGQIKDSFAIRNLWLGDVGEREASEFARTVDSRHCYLNHMDPLESVITLYFRQYNHLAKGNDEALGATICLWPDRRIAKPADALIANAVYPAMLAFSERIWRGGGVPGFISNIPNQLTLRKEFASFENRMLQIQQRFLKHHVFTYTRQSHLQWELFGPFDNHGNVAAIFAIEKNLCKYEGTPFATAYGGTVVLRHFWSPVIEGLLPAPKENSTIYARCSIYSKKNRTGRFWIGFNNISRSPATDTPLQGKWNMNDARIWVNGRPVAPPNWKYAGQTGDAERPLIDEDYAYRAPTPVKLKKGWNKVWVKVPVTTFKGKDWQNPVKWMFTFAEVQNYRQNNEERTAVNEENNPL